MNQLTKILITALLGFGGGFAAGFFVHKKINDVRFEEVTEEEMNAIEEELRKGEEKKTPPSPSNEEKKMEELKKKDLPDDPEELKKVLQGKTPYIQADAEQKRAYEKMWSATKEYSGQDNADNIPVEAMDIEDEEYEDEDEDLILDLEREADDAERWNVAPPHQISLAEFYNDRQEYDKITIDWYQPDDVWLDEREEIIPDIRSYIGYDVVNLFSVTGPEDDADIRFVRNERYSSDYEIIRHHRSFAETIGRN